MLHKAISASDSSRGIVAERCPNYWWLPESARVTVLEALDTDCVDQMVEYYCDGVDERVKGMMREVFLAACAEVRASDLLQSLGGSRHA